MQQDSKWALAYVFAECAWSALRFLYFHGIAFTPGWLSWRA